MNMVSHCQAGEARRDRWPLCNTSPSSLSGMYNMKVWKQTQSVTTDTNQNVTNFIRTQNSIKKKVMNCLVIAMFAVSLSPWAPREWNKIASSHIMEIGWQAGWPHKSCSHLMSGLLTCILNDFHIKAFAGNLLCHSKGFLANWDWGMNALFYLAYLEK